MRTRTRTVRDLLSTFLADLDHRAKREEIASLTPAQYKARLQFAAPLELLPLKDLQVQHLQRWVNQLNETHPTAYAAVTALVQALRFGRRLGWFHHAPELGLVRRRARRKPPRPMNELELRLFFTRCQEDQARWSHLGGLQRARCTAVASLLGLLAVLGLRSGELRTARCNSLDRIDQSLQVRGKRGLRRTALAQPVLALLEERAAWIGTEHAFLFPGRAARPLSPSAVYKGFLRIGEELADERHPHDLRHSFVRYLRRRGKSWLQIADAAGHASPLTSRDVYGDGDDVTPDSRDAAVLLSAVMEVARG